MDGLLSLGAAELVWRIRSGEVTPLEVVDAHIARIEAVNPAINALAAASALEGAFGGWRIAPLPDAS
jgi:Asp-tRNA(Asn)/Glu-tRNA(Gln) amidotransferase A subunit family amidase